jgi:hypothetical protein
MRNVLNTSSLGEKVLDLYKRKKITVSFLVEGKDVESFMYVPICTLSVGEELEVKSIPEKDIRQAIEKEREYNELRKDTSDRGRAALKQVNSFVAEAALSSDRWLRDCAFAAGLIEPEYSILGPKGLFRAGEGTLAEHLQSLRNELLAFDTNIFVSNLFSNYLRLRACDMSNTATVTIPAVIWELERKANDEKAKPRDSRLVKNAFRDVATMLAVTKHFDYRPRETEANPSDRLIRQQIRNLLDEHGKPMIYRRILVTSDRINALAAQAEGIWCCSVDVPEKPWKLQGSKTPNETVGGLLFELAIFSGIAKITCDGMSDYYVMGNWAGKASHEWLSGLVRFDSFPI